MFTIPSTIAGGDFWTLFENYTHLWRFHFSKNARILCTWRVRNRIIDITLFYSSTCSSLVFYRDLSMFSRLRQSVRTRNIRTPSWNLCTGDVALSENMPIIFRRVFSGTPSGWSGLVLKPQSCNVFFNIFKNQKNIEIFLKIIFLEKYLLIYC